MEESAIKGQESLETNDRERGSTISVEGYDTSVHEYPLQLALRKHFASCGKIQRFHIFKDSKRVFLKSPLFISFWKEEEGAVDKALQLSGSDVGGWNVVVKAAPRPEYEDFLPVGNHLRRERQLISRSCGQVTYVKISHIYPHYCTALISIAGKGCVDKIQELMSGRSPDGWNIALTNVLPPMPKSLIKPTGSKNPLFKMEKKKKKMKKRKTTE